MGKKHPLKQMIHMKQFRLFSIALMFVLLITCFVNVYFYRSNMRDQERVRERRIDDLAAVYRDKFKTMGLLVRQLNNSRMVDDLRYVSGEGEDVLKKYQTLIYTLSLIEGSYSGDVRPFVYFHNSNSIVSGAGKMQPALLEQEFQFDGGVDLQTLCHETSKEIRVVPRIGIYYSTSYAMREQASWGTLYLYNQEDVTVMVVSRNATLNEMLSVATQGSDGLFAIWDRASGQAVMSNCDAVFGETFADESGVSAALEANGDGGVLTLRDRGRFVYFTLDSDSPDEVLRLRANVFLWATVTLGVSFAMLYYLLLRREVFRPLASILKKLSYAAPPANEYAAIEDAIFNLQKRIQNLSSELESASEREREGRLRQTILGIENQSAPLIPADGRWFAAAVLICERPEDGAAAEARLRGSFGAQSIANIQEQRVFLLWFAEEGDYADFIGGPAAEGMYALGVSRLHDDPSEIRAAYQEACGVLNACCSGARPAIYVAGRDETDFSVSTPMDVNESGMLLSTIAGGDAEAASQFVAEILDAKRPRTIAQSRHIATYMLNVLGMAQNTARENVFDLTMLTSRIYRMVDAQAMNRIVVESCGALARAFSDSKEDALIRTIRRFVEEHYAENIYLKTVAEETGLSYAYVSHYFSERQGMGFTDYLNSVRIEKACAMLTSRKLTLNEVAEKVGFGSMNTFMRNMKKFTGMTPDAYRRAHAGEGEAREE